MYDLWMPFDLATEGCVCCFPFSKHGTTTNVGFNENLRHVYRTMSLFYDVNLYGC
jgi:hypothetical protein